MSYGTAARALGEAMAAGGFASLTFLRLYEMKDGDLAALVRGLVVAPCARTLRGVEFSFGRIAGGPGLTALGTALGEGRFPALTELHLGTNPIRPQEMEAFLGKLTVGGAPPLEELGLWSIGMGDLGMKALAAALSEGWLGSRLKKLHLGRCARPYHLGFTEEGIMALLIAIKEGPQHVAHLERLELYAPSMSVECATAFVEGVVSSCPSLTSFRLPDLNVSINDVYAAAARASGGRLISIDM